MKKLAPDAIKKPGQLLVLSGPSGSGKSSLVERIRATACVPIELSVSATSRAPRSNEQNGVHYHFLTVEEFARRRDQGDFLECAEVHGNWYGTLRTTVEAGLAHGRWMLLEIDVQGYRAVKKFMPTAHGFFLRAPSLEHYEKRLRDRGTETESSIQRRLADAREQLNCALEYDFQIVNESLEQAARTFGLLLAGLAAQGVCHHA